MDGGLSVVGKMCSKVQFVNFARHFVKDLNDGHATDIFMFVAGQLGKVLNNLKTPD